MFRLTFSKSLADYLAGTEYEVKRLTIQLGKILAPGEESAGLYGIVSNKGVILRVSMYREIAELLSDYDSRYVQEIFVTKVQSL